MLQFLFRSQQQSLILVMMLLFMSVRLIAQNSEGLISYSSISNTDPSAPDVITSPQEMGPNALPVPEVFGGKVGDSLVIDVGASYYFNDESKTISSIARVYFPVVKNKVALEVWAVPLESYEYDSSGNKISGSANGDFYVNTYFQIIEGHRILPDMLGRVGLKTASGSIDQDARYTDAPAYFFDLNFSQKLFHKPMSSLSVSGMYGFYCWQLLNDRFNQNDAHLWGIGLDYHYRSSFAKASLRSFNGYIDNGDKPVVGRIALGIPLWNNLLFELEGEHGFQDFPYNGIFTRLVYTINR